MLPDGGYRLHLVFDPDLDADLEAPGSTVVLCPVLDPTPEGVLSAIAASGMTSADMRTRVMAHLPDSGRVAVLLFAALTGFAGRVVDVSVSGRRLTAARAHGQLAAFRDDGRPGQAPVAVLSGRLDLPGAFPLPEAGPFPPEVVSAVRYASCSVLAEDGRSASELLTSLTVMAGLRVRRRKESFPVLAPVPLPVPYDRDDESAVLPDGCVDLERVRRDAAELRRSLRVDVRDELVPAVPPSERDVRLAAAASLPLEGLLLHLGAREADGVWHCPRPERHTNGDATPSAVLTEEGFRCRRCDLEPVDALRLVIDVRGLTPDEAADLLEAVPSA